MITKQQYVEYLNCTIGNYTGSHLADHLDEVSRDVVTDGDIDWVITNCPDETLTRQVAQEANDVRWQIEELHRGLKQLTGTEKCQCRKGRSQRNHIACC